MSKQNPLNSNKEPDGKKRQCCDHSKIIYRFLPTLVRCAHPISITSVCHRWKLKCNRLSLNFLDPEFDMAAWLSHEWRNCQWGADLISVSDTRTSHPHPWISPHTGEPKIAQLIPDLITIYMSTYTRHGRRTSIWHWLECKLEHKTTTK